MFIHSSNNKALKCFKTDVQSQIILTGKKVPSFFFENSSKLVPAYQDYDTNQSRWDKNCHLQFRYFLFNKCYDMISDNKQQQIFGVNEDNDDVRFNGSHKEKEEPLNEKRNSVMLEKGKKNYNLLPPFSDLTSSRLLLSDQLLMIAAGCHGDINGMNIKQPLC